MGALDWLTSLFSSGPPPGKTYSAPPLANYPTQEDAAQARAAGFAYGSPLEPYANNQIARILAKRAPSVPGEGRWSGRESQPGMLQPWSARGMDLGAAARSATSNFSGISELNRPGQEVPKALLEDVWMRAALASNRIPLSALGMDPRRTAIDTGITHGANFGGVYSPRSDSIYSNLSGGDSLTHESTHRGIQMLRELRDPNVAHALKNLPDEELIVRYLMATQAGDPENTGMEIDNQQRKEAMDAFNDPVWGSTYRKNLGTLDAAAQQAIARRQPMGPR